MFTSNNDSAKDAWLYPRPLTTIAVQCVAVITTYIGRALLPLKFRPSARWVLPASGGTYLILRWAKYRGYSKSFKHTVLDRFGGDVDDAQTWMLGTLGGGAALLLVQTMRRLITGTPEGSR